MSEEFTQKFGEGQGEIITMYYQKPMPMRLDRWLVSQRPEQSRARVQKFIEAGFVRVNGKQGKAKTPLRNKDEVKLWVPPPEPLAYLKPEKMNLDIIFEDDNLIVINKMAGVTVHPAPGNKTGTLVNGLLYHCQDLPGISGKLRPGIVHRLDKDTTGCIVIAKSQEALVKLQIQIQKRIASRNYIAIVHGSPKGEEGVINGAIGRHPSDRKKYAVVSDETGKEAKTYWKILERLKDYTLMSFKLETGRTHQIRVHSAHIGHPILGDVTYSRCRKLPIKLSGQVLHAINLELIHPITHENMNFEAPLPSTFKKLLDILRIKQNN